MFCHQEPTIKLLNAHKKFNNFGHSVKHQEPATKLLIVQITFKKTVTIFDCLIYKRQCFQHRPESLI